MNNNRFSNESGEGGKYARKPKRSLCVQYLIRIKISFSELTRKEYKS